VPTSSSPRARRGAELAAGLAALAIAAGVMTWLSSTDRAQLLFRDGDSVLPVLVLRSLAAGQPQDWALSPVLFAPELALVALFTLLGATPVVALWAAGTAQFALLYGALRYVAGRARLAPWAALAGTALYALLAAAGTSDERRSLELAGLLGTTTYYSGALLATIVVVGAAARFLRDGDPRALALAAITTACGVLCNPLLGAWAVAPIAAAALLLLLRGRDARGHGQDERMLGRDERSPGPDERMRSRDGRSRGPDERTNGPDERMRAVDEHGSARLRPWHATALLLGTLGGASVLGLALRLPLRGLFALDAPSYARPGRWLEALQALLALLEPTPAAFAAAALLLAAGAACWVAARAGLRRRDPGLALLGLVGLLGPPLVLLGSIALGTESPRYLQPIAFLPLLGVAALASVLQRAPAKAAPASLLERSPAAAALPGGLERATAAAPDVPQPQRRRSRIRSSLAPAVSLAAAAALLAVALATPPVLARAAADPDVDCVTDWVERADAVGAGQFWTVRYPKSRLDDPARLVQVTHELQPYAWLVNRADFDVAAVEFLLLDAQSPAFELPAGTGTTPIGCGRYTILQLAEPLALR